MATAIGLFNLPSGKCIEFGTSTIGEGELNTMVIALPTLPIASCNGLGTNICFGGAPAGARKAVAKDWTLWGGGNNTHGSERWRNRPFQFYLPWRIGKASAGPVSTAAVR